MEPAILPDLLLYCQPPEARSLCFEGCRALPTPVPQRFRPSKFAPMPVDHYENFPVASILLPGRLRRPVEVIYRFARAADDIADEGDASPEERLHGLAHYSAALDDIERGATPDRKSVV